jgi:thiol-disulfide isomerase/thioredoxin
MMKLLQWSFAALLLIPSITSANPLHLEGQYDDINHKASSLTYDIGKRPVYLKFWASWCADCRKEFGSLEQAYQKYHSHIAMYAVNLNLNETDESVRAMVKNYKLSIPVVYDRDGSLANTFQLKGTPFHVLIDKKGQVVYTTDHDDATLTQKMEQLAKTSAIAGSRIAEPKISPSILKPLPAGLSLIYFSATWCDNYMPDMQPETARNCVNSNKIVSDITHSKPAVPMRAFVTHLWTTPQDVRDYVTRQKITYPVAVDRDNAYFHHYQGHRYPTIIAFREGKEIRRFENFQNLLQVQAEISTLTQ